MDTHDAVKEYYGKILQGTNDLKTNCCKSERPPQHILDILPKIHDDVQSHYYGCGLVIPTDVENTTVIDLGSGSGRDCYILSHLVGENGHVIGVDMTEEQLAIANKYVDYHTEKFGYKKANVEFRKGYIEDLKGVNIEDNTVDIIVSNCVINLVPNKEDVLRECFRVLKNGGEMYFSDVYSNKRVTDELRNDKLLYGECISGAMYYNDFLNVAKKVGFVSPRLVTSRRLTIDREEVEKKVEGYSFFSATYRLFKCDGLEQGEEDFGDKVTYKGDNSFVFDEHNTFVSKQETCVSRNTFLMLQQSRFAQFFDFVQGSLHLGAFPRGGNGIPFSDQTKSACCKKTSSDEKKEVPCCQKQQTSEKKPCCQK
ncbi:methyltransferase domain-containing protein [Entamoeba marina]